MRYRLSALLMLLACGNPAAPSVPKVSVTMIERTTEGPARTVISVLNETSTAIEVGGCGMFIQGLRDDGWHVVHSPSCIGASISVAPGATHSREFAFLASEATVPADAYRAAVGYHVAAGSGEHFAYSAPLDP